MNVLVLKPLHPIRWPTLSQFNSDPAMRGGHDDAVGGPARLGTLAGLRAFTYRGMEWGATQTQTEPWYDVHVIYHVGFIYIVSAPVRTSAPITAQLREAARTFRITP